MTHVRKAKCVVCGGFRPVAYRSDTGPVCRPCAEVEAGTRQPEP